MSNDRGSSGNAHAEGPYHAQECFISIPFCRELCLPQRIYGVKLIYHIGVVGNLWVLVPVENLLAELNQLLSCWGGGNNLIHATADGILSRFAGIIARLERHIRINVIGPEVGAEHTGRMKEAK